MDGGHLPLDLMRQSGGIDFTVYRLSCHLLGICLVSMLLLVAALTYIYVSILPPVKELVTLLASVKSLLNALRPSKSKYSTYSYSFQSKHINRHRILNILNQETTGLFGSLERGESRGKQRGGEQWGGGQRRMVPLHFVWMFLKLVRGKN